MQLYNSKLNFNAGSFIMIFSHIVIIVSFKSTSAQSNSKLELVNTWNVYFPVK